MGFGAICTGNGPWGSASTTLKSECFPPVSPSPALSLSWVLTAMPVAPHQPWGEEGPGATTWYSELEKEA